ncbi:unnamed protein product [Brassica napus]|uniref:(rape) hypothetical protein n=1 Tax=Brassica napus TaxID=3708 RepID=A0A816WFU6_BRANA|nr:unnamed protein product [Brassica napus]
MVGLQKKFVCFSYPRLSTPNNDNSDTICQKINHQVFTNEHK